MKYFRWYFIIQIERETDIKRKENSFMKKLSGKIPITDFIKRSKKEAWRRFPLHFLTRIPAHHDKCFCIFPNSSLLRVHSLSINLRIFENIQLVCRSLFLFQEIISLHNNTI